MKVSKSWGTIKVIFSPNQKIDLISKLYKKNTFLKGEQGVMYVSQCPCEPVSK